MTAEESTIDHQPDHYAHVHTRHHSPLRGLSAVVAGSALICGAAFAMTLAPSTARPPNKSVQAISTTLPSPPSARIIAPASRPNPAHTNAIASGYGCSAALAYLRTHAAPRFRFQCPGYALGHQGMTCANHPPQCPGERIIVIAVPCRAAYMNEASNSWVVIGLRHHAIDPYGHCH